MAKQPQNQNIKPNKTQLVQVTWTILNRSVNLKTRKKNEK